MKLTSGATWFSTGTSLGNADGSDAGSLIHGGHHKVIQIRQTQSGGKTITTAGMKEPEGSTADVQDRTSQAHKAA